MEHVRIIGWVNIAFAALNLALAAMLFLVLGGAAYLAHAAGPRDARSVVALWGLFSVIAGSFLVLTSLPGLLAGIGLLQWRPWARILTLVLAVFQIIHFPAGTALAIYTFWVLLKPEVAARFDSAVAVCPPKSMRS